MKYSFFVRFVVVFSAIVSLLAGIEAVGFLTIIAKELDATGIGLNNAVSTAAGFAVLWLFGKRVIFDWCIKHPIFFQNIGVVVDSIFIILLWTNVFGLVSALLVGASVCVALSSLWQRSKKALINRCIIKDAASRLENTMQMWSTAGSFVGSLIAMAIPSTMTNLVLTIITSVIVGYISGAIIIRQVLRWNKEGRIFDKWDDSVNV